MTPPSGPDAAVETSSSVDLCRALDTLLRVPGVPERVCALNQAATSNLEPQPCELCATSTTALQTLLPELSCNTPVDNCPLESAVLQDCLQTVGQIMTQALPGCAPNPGVTLDPTTVALRIATSSCAPVLSDCPPLSQLVFGLLGAAL
jgi:hypothetical protein